MGAAQGNLHNQAAGLAGGTNDGAFISHEIKSITFLLEILSIIQEEAQNCQRFKNSRRQPVGRYV
ncbi:hypothetical protein SDC9_151584 [bioreactor metagenome]|uniref:Uncharacterized protein n=1 Tax=bioreactor metagenome TaxID=1076179 RepID=A0A645ER86_9ZZZZ